MSDSKDNITEFKDKLENKQSKLSTIQEKLRSTSDQKIILDRLELEEVIKEVIKAVDCQKNFLEFGTIYKKELAKAIANVTEECRRDATTVMALNEQLGKECAEFQRELRQCQMPKLLLSASEESEKNLSYQELFGKGLTQLFAWSVTFVVWPMALHNPDSELSLLLSEICGMKIKKGPTEVVRRWTCEFLAVVVSMLWWLFLLAIGKKFLWNSQEVRNSQEVNNQNWNPKKSSNKITKWEKLKQKIGRVGKKISELGEMDEEKGKVTYEIRGGAVTPVRPILESHDFLLFVTIHTFKILNSDVIATKNLDSKSFQLNKHESKLKLIWDKFINVLGPIVLVVALSSAQVPNTLQSFHHFEIISQIQSSTNSSMALEIYSAKFQKQVESRAMNFAKAELESESKIETQIQKPKTKSKFGRKRLKKKPKRNFSGKRLKRIKQVKKLSDLPPFENCQNDVLLESSGQSRIPEGIRITSSF